MSKTFNDTSTSNDVVCNNSRSILDDNCCNCFSLLAFSERPKKFFDVAAKSLSLFVEFSLFSYPITNYIHSPA